MKGLKQNISYFLIGLLFCIVIFLSLGSWKPFSGAGPMSAISICCSSDGKIVYVTDFKGVQKTEDGGKTRIQVLSDK